MVARVSIVTGILNSPMAKFKDPFSEPDCIFKIFKFKDNGLKRFVSILISQVCSLLHQKL